MRLIFGAIVGRALHRVGPNSERFGYLQDTHTLRKLLSHLALGRAVARITLKAKENLSSGKTYKGPLVSWPSGPRASTYETPRT